jgi:DNA topoisomerase I
LKLVIVESPAKAKTIGRFLGKDYEVVASYGHIRDLPSSADEIPAKVKSESWARLGVDVEHGYAPVYVVTKESRDRIAELKKLVKDAEEIILATDEDREGESISWHLLETLKPKAPIKRIAFHEITREAIEDALAHPRDVNTELVAAQESRRILDRLFGYSLSPVLWKKIRPKLSAGRVQSVAVRLVVEREEERKAFKSAEYWDAEAELEADGLPFTATLTHWTEKRLASGKDFDGATGELKSDVNANEIHWLRADEAQSLPDVLRGGLPWRVASVEQKEARLSPDRPLITSTLQRAASSLLGFSPRKTMQIAQQLYEGIDLGGGEREGLITYMRTDSVALSEEALREAATVIQDRFGAEYHQRRTYTTKSKMAQEAHEAIRPTHLRRHPDQVRSRLNADQWNLYRLIWNRTLASQMPDAKLLRTAIDIEAETPQGGARFRANGSVVTFPGFLRVADTNQTDTQLPEVKEGEPIGPGQRIALNRLEALSHETKPPARYTEASLIQRLEEEGIGRPSTYAPTISTIQARGYVDLVGKALRPTFLAVATTQLLRDHFPEYVDLGFTARMEDALDEIASGKRDSVKFLDAFYRGHGDYGAGLEPHIEKELPRIDYPVLSLGPDPDSGEPIVVRIGRTGAYVQRGDGGTENNASIPLDMGFEELDAAKAAGLLRDKAKGNEPIGTHPDSGESIFALIGPYGPYVQLGEKTEDRPKPKRASLPKGKSLEDVNLAMAVKLLSLPRVLGTHPETGQEVSAAVGRFGPYVRCEGEFRSLEASDDVYTIDFERALALLAQPKKTRARGKKVLKNLGAHPDSGAAVELCEGRYGPYVTDGSANCSVPKDKDPDTVTLEDAVTLLANAPKKKGGRAAAKPKAKSKAKSKAKAKTKVKAKSKTKAKTKSRAASKRKDSDGASQD